MSKSCSPNAVSMFPRNEPTLGRGVRTDDRPTSASGAPQPHTTWHLEEMFVAIGGKRMYLWRAVDAEGEVLDCLVQSRRDKRAALRLMQKLIRKYRMVPATFVTDTLPSYAAARAELPVTIATREAYDRTTGQRARMFRCGDESE
jgi:transposase-like protein